MSDKQNSKSMIQQIQDEMLKGKKTALKGTLKKLLEERIKAVDIVSGIDDKIIAALEDAGEDVDTLKLLT